MTVKIGGIHATIDGDSVGLVQASKRAEIAMGSMASKWNAVRAQMERGNSALERSLTSVLGPVFSIRSAISTLAGGVSLAALKAIIDSVGGLGEAAEQVNLSTDAYQAYQYAATQAGISQEQLNTALQKFALNTGEAVNGNKTAIDAFDALGVKILDAAGKARAGDEILADVAEGLLRIEDPALRASRAADIFGAKIGQKLLPFLSGGAAGLARFKDEAEKLGLIISGDKIRDADILSDRLAALQLQLGKLAQSLTADLFVDLANLVSFLTGEKLAAGGSNQLLGMLENTRKEIELIRRLVKDGGWFDATQLGRNLGVLPTELESAVSKVQQMEAALKAAAAWGRDLTLSPKFKKDLEDARATVDRLRGIDSQAGFEGDEAAARAGKLPVVTAPGVRNPIAKGSGDNKRELEEYISGLREAASLASAEAKEREVLEAVLRAEGIARKEAAAGQRQSAELTTQEILDIRSSIELKQKNAEAEQIATKAKEEGKALTEQLRTPAEAYAAELERINLLLEQNAIGEDTAARARAQAKKTFEQADEGAQQAKAASDQLAISFKSAFEEAVIGGGKIDDIFEALIQDIIKMIIQLYILKPLLNAIAKQMEGILGGGGGGFLSGLFGGGSSGAVAGAGGGTTGTLPGFASGGSFMVGGSGGTDSQLVAFKATPNERVDISTPGQAAGMGGGSVTVNVINKTDGKARTEERQGDNGEKMIEVIVEKAMRRPGSGVNKALTDTYGAKMQLSRRG